MLITNREYNNFKIINEVMVAIKSRETKKREVSPHKLDRFLVGYQLCVSPHQEVVKFIHYSNLVSSLIDRMKQKPVHDL